MSYMQKGIFTPARNQPLTGRNANIHQTMFRRKQIFQKTPTEKFQTPFSGCNFTGSSITQIPTLAQSQASQFNQENVIRLIKEELQKNGLSSFSETPEESLKYTNELNILRIQVRGIKQSYHDFNKNFKKKLEQQSDLVNEVRKQLNSQTKNNSSMREDISNQLFQKIQEVQQSIAVKMRLVFTKLQEDLRKELTNYTNREFVPTSFLDDLDKQLNELDDRIASIEAEYQANKSKGNKLNTSKAQKDSSMIISSGSELKVKQFERDLINLKKELDEKSQKIQEIDQSTLLKYQQYSKQLKEVKQSLLQVSSQTKKNQKAYEALKQNMEKDKKKIFAKIESDFDSITRKIDQQLVLKSLSLSNSLEPQCLRKKTENTSIIIQNVEQLAQSSKIQQNTKIKDDKKISSNSDDQNLSTSVNLASSKFSPSKTKKIMATSGGDEKSKVSSQKKNGEVRNEEQLVGSNSSLQQQVKTLYKVDKDGYLMDSNNKYLLNQSNTMIYVSDQQIETMQRTNLVKIQKCGQ